MTVKIERNLSLTEVKNRFLRPGDGYKKDAVVAGLHQKPNRNPAKRLPVWKGAADDMTSAATCPVLIKNAL